MSGVARLATGAVRGGLPAPASKSMTIRHTVAAALADGRSVLTGPLDATDTRAVRAGVEALGARVEDLRSATGRASWAVTGTAGAPATPDGPVDCRLSGTTMRILTAVATHAPGPVTITGDPPLLRRRIGALVAALRTLGAELEDAGGFPPVRLAGGGLHGGVVDVDVSTSSQYASAVLLAAPLARTPVTVRTHGAAAHAYIDLTVQVLRGVGVGVDADDGGDGWRVTPAMPKARDVTVEHDASAACHLHALAVATAGAVTVTNAGPTLQPDAALTDVFAAMGAGVTRDGVALTVAGPDQPLAVDVDLSGSPDQVTTVAALAALSGGTSHIRGVGVTRGHETDRLAALATELRRLGAHVEETADALAVTGRGTAGLTGPRAGGSVLLRTYGDHRLAMAFAALAARIPGVVIDDPGCVDKTYPRFWTDLAALGVEVDRSPHRT